MNKIDQSIIDELCRDQATQVLSIYTPTHQVSTPSTIKEDQVRLKNLINDGIRQLAEAEPMLDTTSVRRQLDEALDKAGLWGDAVKSVAVFVGADDVHILHLPIECTEYVAIGAKYDITPLQLALDMNQPFYVFALAKHHPKLFKGDLYGLQPVAIDFPSSAEDALHIDEMFANSNTVRGFGAAGGGGDMLNTHGQGDSNHAGQEERLMYFRILDNLILTSKSVDSNAPFIVAATQSEATDFKSLSKIPRLLETYISGNHSNTPLHKLYSKAWDAIAKGILGQKANAVIGRFNELKGLQRGSSDPDEILLAAKAGRVETLLVGLFETTHDSIDDGTHTKDWVIRLNHHYRSRIADLVSAIKAQGGKIVGVDSNILATPTHVAAVYRY